MEQKKRPVKIYSPEYRKDEHGEFYNIRISFKKGFVEVQIDVADYDDFKEHNWSVLTVRGTPKYLSRHLCTDEGGNKQRQQLHQLLMGTNPDTPIDHINGDGFNCRRYNMRTATREQNAQNSKKRMNASSVYKGVSWKKRLGRWVATIRVDKKQTHIRSFVKDIVDGVDEGEKRAARAYDESAVENFGAFASLNFPESRNFVNTVQGEKFLVSYLFNEQELKKIESNIMELQRFKPKEILEILENMPLPEIVKLCHYYGCGIEELVKELEIGVKLKTG